MNHFRIQWAKYIGIAFICVMLGGCTRLFFFPMPQHVSAPSALGYTYEDVFLRAADDTHLHAWLIKPKPPLRGTVYFLHGNAENISTHFRATVWLLESGYQVFALDYRGYGLSAGKPDVPEVFLDIEAGADWINRHLSNELGERESPLFLFGQSLGASLAITYAHRDTQFNSRFDGLITEAAFSRFDSIAKHVAAQNWITWGVQYPAKWLIGQKYDPLDAIGLLEGTPKLLVHSTDDEIIPYRFGKALFDRALEPKEWIVASGAHIRAAADPAVRASILTFMQRYGPPETLPTR